MAFILDRDSSVVRVGGVLAQVGPDGDRVVAYTCRVLNKDERCYCVNRRELFGGVLSIRHGKYLHGLPFTDHSAIQWLMTFRVPWGQVAKWLEKLQAFPFRVEHRVTPHQCRHPLTLPVGRRRVLLL